MSTKTIYNDDDARYTDAPPEVDEAFDYAVKHNRFLTQEQFFDLLKNSKQETQKDSSFAKKRSVSTRQAAAYA